MTEEQKAFMDLVNYGSSYIKDGKHIPIEDVKLMPVGNDEAIGKFAHLADGMQSDGIHTIGYGHPFASGDEGHGQE